MSMVIGNYYKVKSLGLIGRYAAVKSMTKGKPVRLSFSPVLNPIVKADFQSDYRNTELQEVALNQEQRAALAAHEEAQKQKFERKWFLNRMQEYVDVAKKAQEKLLEKMGGEFHHVTYEMQWLRGTYAVLYKGSVAKSFLDRKTQLENEEQPTTQEGMDKIIDQVMQEYNDFVDSALESWRPEGSTSWTSNGCNDEKYTALRDLKRKW